MQGFSHFKIQFKRLLSYFQSWHSLLYFIFYFCSINSIPTFLVSFEARARFYGH